MNLTEKTLSQKNLYNGKIINLRVDQIELPNGNQAVREVVEHPGAVCIVALNENDEIYLVKQFRYPHSQELLELPAGKLEKGENPLDAGKRELREETGCIGKDYFDLGKFYGAPAFCEEVVYTYRCTVDSVAEMNLDDDEFLQVVKMPLKQAVELVTQNRICDGKTQAGILKAAIQKNIF